MSSKHLLVTAAILGGLAVVLGAFGAHGLKPRLTSEQLASFETGVRYQMYHALAIIACAWLLERGLPAAGTAGLLFTLGIALFSGSIYLLSTRGLTGLEARWLGPVTPLGGLSFIAGWAALAIAAARMR